MNLIFKALFSIQSKRENWKKLDPQFLYEKIHLDRTKHSVLDFSNDFLKALHKNMLGTF